MNTALKTTDYDTTVLSGQQLFFKSELHPKWKQTVDISLYAMVLNSLYQSLCAIMV